MGRFRDIDQRDLDALLRAFTDVQIADLYGVPVKEVAAIRQRQNRLMGEPLDALKPVARSDIPNKKQDPED